MNMEKKKMNTDYIKKRIAEIKNNIDLKEQEKQELELLLSKLEMIESGDISENHSQQLLKG